MLQEALARAPEAVAPGAPLSRRHLVRVNPNRTYRLWPRLTPRITCGCTVLWLQVPIVFFANKMDLPTSLTPVECVQQSD